MKKTILFIFAFCFCLTLFSDFSPITNQASKEISARKGLGLKRINAYCFFPNGVDSILRQVILFDELGRLHTNMLLDNTGKHVSLKMEIKYLSNSELIYSVTTQVFLELQKAGVKSVYFEYDSLGRVIKQYTFNEDTSNIMVETFLFGPNKKAKVSTMKFKSGNVFVRHQFYYDSLANLVKTNTYNENKELLYSDVSERSGNTEYLFHVIGEERTLQKTTEYEGDKVVKTIEPDSDLHKDVTTYYYYDVDGFPAEQDLKLHNKLLLRVKFIYVYK